MQLLLVVGLSVFTTVFFSSSYACASDNFIAVFRKVCYTWYSIYDFLFFPVIFYSGYLSTFILFSFSMVVSFDEFFEKAPYETKRRIKWLPGKTQIRMLLILYVEILQFFHWSVLPLIHLLHVLARLSSLG